MVDVMSREAQRRITETILSELRSIPDPDVELQQLVELAEDAIRDLTDPSE